MPYADVSSHLRGPLPPGVKLQTGSDARSHLLAELTRAENWMAAHCARLCGELDLVLQEVELPREVRWPLTKLTCVENRVPQLPLKVKFDLT